AFQEKQKIIDLSDLCLQNITKTRTIRFCCIGYEGNISINDTICKPVCRGGCGRGYCLKPDQCSCEPGYMGKHCTQRCDHDHWGLECKNVCLCHNGAACDNKSGICHCTIGWTGELSWPHQNATSTEEKINLAGFGVHSAKNKEDSSKSNENHNSDHENSLLTTLLVILLIIMVAIGFGFLYVYRRYHLQKAQVEAALAARNVSLVPGLSAPIVITPPPLPPHQRTAFKGYEWQWFDEHWAVVVVL
ncbi:hypothetical protein DOY81_009456, partial [Sarcophaga bullata]